MDRLGGPVDVVFRNNTERGTMSHNVRAGLERQVSSTLLVGLDMLYNHSDITLDVLNRGEYDFAIDPFLAANINILGTTKWDNIGSTLFLEKKIGEKGSLNVDADYLYFLNDSPINANNNFSDVEGRSTDPANDLYVARNRGQSNTSIHIGVLKSDFSAPINEKVSLSTGFKATYSITNNEGQIEQFVENEWVTDSRNITALETEEAIGAGYLSLDYNLNATVNLTAGVRYEYWDRKFSEGGVNRSFGRFFPSFFLTKKLGDETSLQLAYNKRITRPDYNDLASFLRYNDPQSVFTGNPLLNPNIVHSVKVGYQWKGNTFSLTYNDESSPITRFQITTNEEEDLLLVSPQNTRFQRSISFQTNIPLEVNDWWSMTVGGNISYRRFQLQHTAEQLKKGYVTYRINGSQNFKLPKDFSLELSGWFNARYLDGSREVGGNGGFGILNLGVRKKLKGDHGSLQFSVTDLLRSMTIQTEYGTLTREALNNRAFVRFQPESANTRIFRLSYTRSFGNNKAKVNRRSSGANEERSRVRQ